MIERNIELTPDDILGKEFKIDTKGYRLIEVDKFLDTVVKDYEKFTKIVKKLEEMVQEANEENGKLKTEVRNLKLKIDIAKQGEKEITNVDLLKRISEIEKVVFGNDN